jgi:MFS family permease
MTTIDQISQPVKTKPVHPLRVRDFRLLWIGQSVSMLGDQFYLIALPWLVLQITGSPLALGTVLALASIPRALFMLIGGALVDRFSPRNVMFVSNLVRMILVALLAVLVFTGSIQLWMLYVLALGFGTADAFFFPADNAMVPRLLEKDQLEVGNTLTQGVGMLSMFLGPVLAGGIIALLAGSATTAAGVEAGTPGFEGIGIAFALDAVSFLVSLFTLSRIGAHKPVLTEAQEKTSVLSSIKEGLAFVWSDTALRMVFLVMVATNFVVNGPFEVGIPVLAKRNFVEGAAAYGIIVSAFGGGALVGVILASILPRPRPSRFGTILLGVTSLLGIGMIALPFSATIPAAAIISLAMGIVMGYVNIHIFTWMQKRVPEQFMGRTMSLAMFAAVGLAPVSSALAGAVINVNLTLLFVVAGIFMSLVTFGSTLRHEVRDMGLGVIEPSTTPPTDTTVRATDEIPAVRRTDTIPAVHL